MFVSCQLVFLHRSLFSRDIADYYATVSGPCKAALGEKASARSASRLSWLINTSGLSVADLWAGLPSDGFSVSRSFAIVIAPHLVGDVGAADQRVDRGRLSAHSLGNTRLVCPASLGVSARTEVRCSVVTGDTACVARRNLDRSHLRSSAIAVPNGLRCQSCDDHVSAFWHCKRHMTGFSSLRQ